MNTAPGVDDEVELLVPEEETVPESDLHRIVVDLFAAGLAARFADAADVAVFARLAWFPDASDTRIRLDPDVMVVRGRPPGHRKSYQAWVEGGVQPALLIEVWSEEDTDAAYRRRLERARTYGVQEVVLVNPYGAGGARVERLLADPDDSTRFRTAASSSRGDRFVAVPSLGIEIAGGAEIVVREDGRSWPTTADAFRRLWAAEARADEAEARAAALASRLRAAGLDD